MVRLVARGHWMREHRPVRSPREDPVIIAFVPQFAQGGFLLSGNVNAKGEISLSITMEQKSVTYPLGAFPEIREFAGMLEHMRTGGLWDGVHFHGYTVPGSNQKPMELAFRRHRDGVALAFSIEEWQHLRGLIAAALTAPKLRPFWEELELVYGEL